MIYPAATTCELLAITSFHSRRWSGHCPHGLLVGHDVRLGRGHTILGQLGQVMVVDGSDAGDAVRDQVALRQIQSLRTGIALERRADRRVRGVQLADEIDDLDLLTQLEIDDLVAEHAVEQALDAVAVLADDDLDVVRDQELLEGCLHFIHGVETARIGTIADLVGLAHDESGEGNVRVTDLRGDDADRLTEGVHGTVGVAHGGEDHGECDGGSGKHCRVELVLVHEVSDDVSHCSKAGCRGLASSRVDTSFRRYSLCYSLPSD